MSRRPWIAVGAVLCAGGVAATLALNGSSDSGRREKAPVSAACAQYIAEVEKQLAAARAERKEDKGGVLSFSRIRTSEQENCDEELRDHFDATR